MNKEIGMSGIELACRYSYGCTMATRLNINNLLLEGATEGKNLEKIAKTFEQFDFFPFFETIASAKKENIWEKNVVRAYWLADDVDRPCNSHGAGVLHDLEIIMNTKQIKENVINILLDCLVSSARIKDIQQKGLFLIENKKVVFRDKAFFLTNEEKIVEQVVPDNFKKGQLVSLHLGKIRERITINQETSLLSATKRFFSIN